MHTLGARLTNLREKKGWTKTYVSKKLGMKTVSTYANWEYDTRQPDNDMIVKLAELFDVPTDYLLGRTDQKNTSDNYEIQTLAAHHDGEDWTDEELEEIERFKEFVRMKRGNKQE